MGHGAKGGGGGRKRGAKRDDKPYATATYRPQVQRRMGLHPLGFVGLGGGC